MEKTTKSVLKAFRQKYPCIMFPPPHVSVKLTKSKATQGGGAGLILSGWFLIPTCGFRWLEGCSKAGGGAPARQYTLPLLPV